MAIIKDIARVIAAKHQLKQADADHFVQMFVETIDEGLMKDRQVKIKGFGTFKLQTVKERTSVNVNTGEKVVIGEHDKVTFTPDNVMRDIVNKPFAQFETVVVEDNSPLLDGTFEMAEDEEEATSADETVEMEVTPLPVAPVEEPVPAVEEAVPAAEEPVDEPAASATEEAKEPVDEQEIPATEEVKEPVVEETHEEIVEKTHEEIAEEAHEEIAEEAETIDEEEEESCDRQYPRCRNIFIYYGILINIIVAVIAFVLGYFAASNNWFGTQQECRKPVPVVVEKKDAKAKGVAKIAETDTVKAEKPETAKQEVPEQDTQEVKQEPKTVELPAKKAEPEQKPLTGYDGDPRVRTGAYYIMGTDQVVTVKEGQTIAGIARTYLGPDMECYVEAYNGVKTVKAGDKVKIPKLMLKKRLKKKD